MAKARAEPQRRRRFRTRLAVSVATLLARRLRVTSRTLRSWENPVPVAPWRVERVLRLIAAGATLEEAEDATAPKGDDRSESCESLPCASQAQTAITGYQP